MEKIIEVLQALVAWLVGGTVGETTYTGAIQSFLGVITENELLLTFFVLGLIGLGIGIITRLTSANR